VPVDTVLVIDDSPTILKVVQLVLTKAGFKVQVAPDGEEGIRRAMEQLKFRGAMVFSNINGTALSHQRFWPLWEAANRTPQPNGGYLPETGVLTELQDASKKQQFGRTVLLVMKALGPNGAEDAHLIALGDSIRALKRAGLEADARRLGLEALLADGQCLFRYEVCFQSNRRRQT